MTHLNVAVALDVKGGEGTNVTHMWVLDGSVAHKVDDSLRAGRQREEEHERHEQHAEHLDGEDLDAQLEERAELLVHGIRVQPAAPGRGVIVRVLDDAAHQHLRLEYARLVCGAAIHGAQRSSA